MQSVSCITQIYTVLNDFSGLVKYIFIIMQYRIDYRLSCCLTASSLYVTRAYMLLKILEDDLLFCI
jgi:hypothetical protein